MRVRLEIRIGVGRTLGPPGLASLPGFSLCLSPNLRWALVPSLRRPSRLCSGYPAASSYFLPAPHPEGCDQQEDSERHGVGSDQPHQREYAHRRQDREDQPEEHRGYAAEDEGPSALDLLAQPDCRVYLNAPVMIAQAAMR